MKEVVEEMVKEEVEVDDVVVCCTYLVALSSVAFKRDDMFVAMNTDRVTEIRKKAIRK